MSVKLIVLKSDEHVVSDAKELVDDTKSVKGYLLHKPHKVMTQTPLLLTEEQSNDNSVEVTLSPWILLSKDEEVVIKPLGGKGGQGVIRVKSNADGLEALLELVTNQEQLQVLQLLIQ